MRNPTPGAENAPHHGGHSGPSADLLGQMAYETRDVSLVALGRWLGVFVVFIIGSLSVGYGVFKVTVLGPMDSEKGTLVAHVRHLPPFPQLQTDPKTDMMDYRNAEDQVLTGKGSGSMKPGLSIDDAINMQANDRGIAGVKGDATPWNYSTKTPEDNPGDKSYPGGGDYGSKSDTTAPAADATPGIAAPTPAADGMTPPEAPGASAPATVPAADPSAPNGNGTRP